ncbi:MAG: AMP-binding protein [Verrucomicrobiota bacterium]
MERVELARLLRVRSADGIVAEARDGVVVEEREPGRFREAFAEAVAAGGTVFLANPDWGAAERSQFNVLVQSKIHTEAGRPTSDNPNSQISHGWLCIPTGGSAGRIKLARHDQDTLHAAVRGFCTHFGVARVNAVGVLPLHHVGGLMGWLRAELTRGSFLACEWKKLEASFAEAPGANPAGRPDPTKFAEGCFLSLVPTQLQRLLAWPAAVVWLRGFRAVLVGGGPAWAELAEAGARAGLPLAFTYGATETAAAVAALRPEEFRGGGRGCGTALPHGQITVGEAGEILVEAESLFRGYWPDWRTVGAWRTGDRGFFDERGSLHVTGRHDTLIITGGEKVEPNEVEAVLRATGEFADVAVIGVPDPQWGEVVIACYPAGGRVPDPARVAAGLETLAMWKRPKRLVAVPETAWPRDASGKIDRATLRRAQRAR